MEKANGELTGQRGGERGEEIARDAVSSVSVPRAVRFPRSSQWNPRDESRERLARDIPPLLPRQRARLNRLRALASRSPVISDNLITTTMREYRQGVQQRELSTAPGRADFLSIDRHRGGTLFYVSA